MNLTDAINLAIVVLDNLAASPDPRTTALATLAAKELRNAVGISTTSAQSPQQVLEILLAKGWRQVEIAQKVGLSQPNISRILKGQQGARYEYVDAMRALLDQKPPRRGMQHEPQ